MDLKFWVDIYFLESKIALGFMTSATSYGELTDTQVRSFLEEQVKEGKEVVTLDMIEQIVQS